MDGKNFTTTTSFTYSNYNIVLEVRADVKYQVTDERSQIIEHSRGARMH
jgi:hypothetical protein